MDVAKRVIDLGHPSTVYFPLVVEEALMVEPTETETKESLDAFADASFRRTGRRTTIPSSCEAPVTTPVRRLDEARAAASQVALVGPRARRSDSRPIPRHRCLVIRD